MTNLSSMRSSKIPDIEKLHHDPGYRQILELEFSDMIPFVLSNIRKKGLFSILYLTINMAFLAFIILYAIWGLLDMQITWATIIKQTLSGIFAGSILVIPVHEILHGLAYRILGARKIEFGADLQQFIFFVTADRYPVSGNQLYFLAMTPFVVINLVIVAITALVFPQVILFAAFLLLSHNIMCIGDFAIVNYVRLTPGGVITYDETENKRSYFFQEVTDKME